MTETLFQPAAPTARPTLESRVLGIDPGIGGGLALVSDGQVLLVDPPVTETTAYGYIRKIKGKLLDKPRRRKITKRRLNAALLVAWIRQWAPDHAYCERPTPRMDEGVTSAFSSGQNFGILVGVLAAMGIPTTFVSAVSWKRSLALIGKGKGDSIARAMQLYPAAAMQMQRKKDHGRAEALLIAHYGMRQARVIA